MNASIDNQVIDFYYALFGKIFSEPFRARLSADRRRRDAVVRQIEDSASAASGSLSRFFLNRQMDESQVADILAGYAPLSSLLRLEHISNTNIAPQSLADDLLGRLSLPSPVQKSSNAALYRLGLLLVVRTLTYVAPVMAEWQRLNFASTFEFPRRITDRLNQISERVDLIGRDISDAADGRFEILYRDYLLTRFLRVEAGTVRLTTNLDVDLRELFVMPRVRSKQAKGSEAENADALMNLTAARRFFGDVRGFIEHNESKKGSRKEEDTGITALEQVTTRPRSVIIGAPGGGKSTFLEWLQLRIAYAEVGEEFLLAGKQAIPLLLRVRELKLKSLPQDAEIIRYATASRDFAAQMPDGWLDRQMRGGRVLFMLDGLDETEPDLRDKHLLPWLQDLCKRYPRCRFVISSRPAGYPPGTLPALKFNECELLDFDEEAIKSYTRNWCTAVRLARNEPEEEARTEGAVDGANIVVGFQDNRYIRNLARNPLMLSAICLVNYFEGGQLPKDRAVLYKLCVEGLLHHWDQRRGIHSEFGLEEKLRACREVAIEMQTNDLAEYEAEKVEAVFARVLNDAERAKLLLEHIRYRTGLLLERRAGVFAFAHLTFQEYLAALAVHEGNRCGVNAEQLAREHYDARWREVIALYCGLAPTLAARRMLELLINQSDTRVLTHLLAEAYVSVGSELLQNQDFRREVIRRVAIAPTTLGRALSRFPPEEVAPIANSVVGTAMEHSYLSEAFFWFWFVGQSRLDTSALLEQLQAWRTMKPIRITESMILLHQFGRASALAALANDADLYKAPATELFSGENGIQAYAALSGLSARRITRRVPSGVDAALLQILRAIHNGKIISQSFPLSSFLEARLKLPLPDSTSWSELASLTRHLAKELTKEHNHELQSAQIGEAESPLHVYARENRKRSIAALNSWADSLEQAIATKNQKQIAPKTKSHKTSKHTTANKIGKST